MRSKLVSFSYQDGPARKVGIYPDGSVITLSNVALLNQHDSDLVMEIRGTLASIPDVDRSTVMQQVLSVFHRATLHPAAPIPACALDPQSLCEAGSRLFRLCGPHLYIGGGSSIPVPLRGVRRGPCPIHLPRPGLCRPTNI